LRVLYRRTAALSPVPNAGRLSPVPNAGRGINEQKELPG